MAFLILEEGSLVFLKTIVVLIQEEHFDTEHMTIWWRDTEKKQFIQLFSLVAQTQRGTSFVVHEELFFMTRVMNKSLIVSSHTWVPYLTTRVETWTTLLVEEQDRTKKNLHLEKYPDSWILEEDVRQEDVSTRKRIFEQRDTLLPGNVTQCTSGAL